MPFLVLPPQENTTQTFHSVQEKLFIFNFKFPFENKTMWHSSTFFFKQGEAYTKGSVDDSLPAL